MLAGTPCGLWENYPQVEHTLRLFTELSVVVVGGTSRADSGVDAVSRRRTGRDGVGGGAICVGTLLWQNRKWMPAAGKKAAAEMEKELADFAKDGLVYLRLATQ
jgi:hypothetical protein